MTSIVIDTCVMSLYDTPMDPTYKDLFSWLFENGTLVISQHLLNEYNRSNNYKIFVLLEHLMRHEEHKRLVKIPNDQINQFKEDKKFKYTCNQEDINNARLVFLSERKKLITHDKPLTTDVNKFKKVDGIKPKATKQPSTDFYS
ncbi:DUF2492 family protein [Cellvibrio sp. PSBB006]|uniref:DUF2492 family protein n=1 Tax=Cellvibrio sp. PSBB006 TaxID=1987723 RepID=UPI000B3B888B|nr:DUF2492 family protein [Cellvibrio sp. PSBB006]ARU27070.1 hypothetical protein CBR65_06235 [Cellvibrio sp. PSBB006]